MPRYSQGRADRGSQKWLQHLVNSIPDVINEQIAQFVPFSNPDDIDWLSPVREDEYAEYRDRAFVDRLELDLKDVPLKDFWPKGGPVWDGLAKAGDHRFLLEAKAHIPELNSTPMKASQRSAVQIQKSLAQTKQYLGSGAHVDWSSSFYQYANRMAHLYLLRTLNGLDAWLINVYFFGDTDMDGPMSAEEWMGAIRLMKSHLGIGRHPLRDYEVSLFIDVRGFEPTP